VRRARALYGYDSKEQPPFTEWPLPPERIKLEDDERRNRGWLRD
jgi:hypothetical protein